MGNVQKAFIAYYRDGYKFFICFKFPNQKMGLKIWN